MASIISSISRNRSCRVTQAIECMIPWPNRAQKTSRQAVKKSPAIAPKLHKAAKPPQSPPKAQNPPKANGSTPSAAARRPAARRCATCSAARARGSPKWPISACRCRPASPSPPRSARYFYDNGKTYPKDLKAQVDAALAEVGRITGKKFGDGENPLLVSVRSGGARLDAGHDGHRAQSRAQRRHRRGAGGEIRRPALCLRQLPALHHHVCQRGARHRASSFRGNPRRPQGPQRLHARHRSQRRRLGQHHRPLQGARRGGERQAVPARPARAIVGRHRRGVRLVDEPARHHLSPPARHSGKLGHRGQRAGHGVRQYGRDLGDRRRLHAQSLDRREEALRRISDQRPGRGRRRRHPHAAGDHRSRRARRPARTSRRWNRRCRTPSPSSSASTPRWSGTTATCRISNSPSSRASCGCCRRATASAPRKRRCASRSSSPTRN